MQGNEAYKNLIEMGISPILSEAAVRKTKSTDVSALLDWVSAHENEEVQLKEWLEEVKKNPAPLSEEKPVSQEGESISHLVNADLNASLQSMGHSKNVSEKAIFMTGNNNLEAAQRWIEDHKYDADFEEELKMVGQPVSTLTEEEAKQKLAELQKKIRENRAKKEAEDALEREKNRMRYGKEMVEAKKMAEEMQVKRQMELDKIQKQKDDDYKKRLLLDMKRERCLKLGIPFNEAEALREIESKASQKPTQPVHLSKSDRIMVQLEQVKVGSFAYPEKANTFFQTAKIYINNIINNPTEPKFRKINTSNQAFQNRVAGAFGGVEALHAIGFENDGQFLSMNNPDIGELKEIVKALDRYIAFY